MLSLDAQKIINIVQKEYDRSVKFLEYQKNKLKIEKDPAKIKELENAFKSSKSLYSASSNILFKSLFINEE